MDSESKSSSRNKYAILGFIIAFLILSLALFDLQMVRKLSIDSLAAKTRTIGISGMRGRILDVNGYPLAFDQKSFNIEFYREYTTKKDRPLYTNSIIRSLEIFDAYKVQISNRFAVRINADGTYEFYFGNVTPEQFASKEKRFRQDFYFNKNETPQEIVAAMRERYSIPESFTDEQSLRVLAIWQDSIQSAYMAQAVVIASNVPADLINEMAAYSYKLAGFNVVEATQRVYPQGETAGHLVGYLGKIDSNNIDYYVKQMSYNVNDLVGTYGIEKEMESYLTGNGPERSGSRNVEVSASGNILRELSFSPPSQGQNVYLTVDINMQKVLDKALAKNIADINAMQQKEYYDENGNEKEKYINLETKRGGKKTQFATIGAAVVMDVSNGSILAMSSYPGFDPNLFAKGITIDEYNTLINDPRKPLFNNAISSSNTPGSIFKMVTGIAGLTEGKLGLGETIQDLGEYRKYVDSSHAGPKCWIYRDFGSTHGNLDVVGAIKNSCNYFFFETADRLTADGVKTWADNFGLTTKTNIELTGEIKGVVGNQQVLYDKTKPVDSQDTNIPALVQRAIKEELNVLSTNSNTVISDDDKTKITDSIMQLVGGTRSENLKGIHNILCNDYGFGANYVDADIRYRIQSYLEEITWTGTQTITTGIGQSITMVTPIAVARYIGSLVNGGYVYDTHMVQKVTDASGALVMEKQPVIFKNLGVKKEYLDAMKEGMRDVVAGDDGATASQYFSNFKYKDQIGGKTGSAQVSDIGLETNSWFVCFAPYEKPEIAVVVYIPNGWSGGRSTDTAKAIVQYYLDKKNMIVADNVTPYNTLVE